LTKVPQITERARGLSLLNELLAGVNGVDWWREEEDVDEFVRKRRKKQPLD